MKNTSLLFQFVCLSLLFISIDLSAQNSKSSEQEAYNGYSVYVSSFVRLKSTIEFSDKMGYGAGVEYSRAFSNKIGASLRLSVHRWSPIRETMIPLNLGPTYRAKINDNLDVLAFFVGGPAGVIGNDYAGFFGNFETGIQLNRSIANDKAIFVRASFGQLYAFHPDHYEFSGLSIGMKF